MDHKINLPKTKVLISFEALNVLEPHLRCHSDGTHDLQRGTHALSNMHRSGSGRPKHGSQGGLTVKLWPNGRIGIVTQERPPIRTIAGSVIASRKQGE